MLRYISRPNLNWRLLVYVLCNAKSMNFTTTNRVSPHFSAESIVEPNQKKYPWYHETFVRVPTIDQCHTDDAVCVFEANQQFRRDKMVENEILSILRQRFEDCMLYEAPDHVEKCTPLLKTYERGAENWFAKCEY